MIGLLLGVFHYLEATYLHINDDGRTTHGDIVIETPNEAYYDELMREEEERYMHEVDHGWEDSWHGSFYEQYPGYDQYP